MEHTSVFDADNLSLYGWSALFLVGTLLFAKSVIQTIEARKEAERNHLKELLRLKKEKYEQDVKDLKQAFESGLKEYESFDKSPMATSSLGIRNGLFTWWRHGDATKYRTFLETIQNQSDLKTLKITISRFIVDEGGTWSQTRGHNHHMTNFFFKHLKIQNFSLYLDIVEDAYHLKFLRGENTLYRRDNRSQHDVFKDGFLPKENLSNQPQVRRANFVQQVTLDYGVSLSKGIPPKEYGFAGVYIIVIPEDHHLQLLDITQSPRHRNSLSPYRRQLLEVNAVEGIPREYIAGFMPEKHGVDMRFEIMRLHFGLESSLYSWTIPADFVKNPFYGVPAPQAANAIQALTPF